MARIAVVTLSPSDLVKNMLARHYLPPPPKALHPLVGRTIVRVRSMTLAEMKRAGLASELPTPRLKVAVLDDGTRICLGAVL